jgi:hypothetical protein
MPATPRGPSNWRTDALPPRVGARIEEAFGLDRRPESLVELAVAVRRRLDAAPPGTGALTVADLYEVDESPHAVRVGGRTHRVRSVLDGYVLAALDPRPVEVRSRDPVTDDAVTVRLDDDDAAVDPAAAVVSVGAPADATWRDSLTADDAYETLCPRAGVFADEGSCREWADRTDAAVTSVSPTDATALGWALTGRVDGDREALVDQRGVFSPRDW